MTNPVAFPLVPSNTHHEDHHNSTLDVVRVPCGVAPFSRWVLALLHDDGSTPGVIHEAESEANAEQIMFWLDHYGTDMVIAPDVLVS